MSDPEKETEELLPCPTRFDNGEICCVMGDGGTLFHVEECPAKHRRVIAATLRKRDEEREDASAIGHERIVALESRLAAAAAEIEALNEDIAEWTRMAKRKDKIIDELRAEIAQLKAQLKEDGE